MQYGNSMGSQGKDNGQMGGGQMGGGMGGGGAQMPDVFNKGNADMLMNYGLSQGQNILKSQGDKWMPQVSGFWNSLKVYFAVNNSYVLKKLQMILHPLGVKKTQYWVRKSAETDGYDQTGDIRTKWALPRDDTCAPDLYIPLMSFITYVLLFGLYTGMAREPIYGPDWVDENGIMHGGIPPLTGDNNIKQFSPEVLISAVWTCFIVQIVEVVICYIGLNFLSCSLPMMDIFAYTGYKYVGLCVGIISRLFGGMISTIVILYTSGALAFFFLKSMASIVPPSSSSSDGGMGGVTCNRHWVLLSLSAVQFVVAFSLSWF